MNGYIDADKLMNFANNMKDKTIDANDIARFPTADVRENVKGEWEDDREHNCYLCSVCGLPGLKSFGFCPNCGADMRGEA